MRARGQLVSFTCVATFLFDGLDCGTAISRQLEELMKGCIPVKLPESLKPRDEQAHYQPDEYQERKRARIVRLKINNEKCWHHIMQTNAGGCSETLDAHGHAVGTEIIERHTCDGPLGAGLRFVLVVTERWNKAY